jgi:hypothetical protein
MELFERLLYLHQDPVKIAAGFADDMRNNPEADRSQIPAALASILQARSEYQAQAEEIEREQRERVAPWEDFGGIPDQAHIETWRAQADKEAKEEEQRVKETITALNALFCEICRALDAEGLTLTGGQISALKRAGLPDALAEELETIKGVHLASIPEAERLGDESATALYKELTLQGLISGPYAAFSYYLVQVTQGKQKAPGEGLKWTGNKAEFAYFARLFSEFTQPGGMGQPYIREKALCRAFGLDDRQRVNTIRPYLSDQYKPRTSAKIEAAFAAAWRAKNEALAASTDEPGRSSDPGSLNTK